jgi:hypothetical protein
MHSPNCPLTYGGCNFAGFEIDIASSGQRSSVAAHERARRDRKKGARRNDISTYRFTTLIRLKNGVLIHKDSSIILKEMARYKCRQHAGPWIMSERYCVDVQLVFYDPKSYSRIVIVYVVIEKTPRSDIYPALRLSDDLNLHFHPPSDELISLSRIG